MKKPLVVYHGPGCVDGAGAALAAEMHFGIGNVELRPAQYGDPAPTTEEVCNREVYVLDFSYERSELLRIHFETGGRLHVVDHHKTAQAACGGLSYCHFDMNRSGAMLAWEFFHGDAAPELFAYIQDRDLWRWELPSSREISAALAAHGCGDHVGALYGVLCTWRGSPKSTFDQLRIEGTALLLAQTRDVARIVSLAEVVEIAGHRGLASSCPLHISEAAGVLALKSGTFGALWYRDGAKGRYNVSLRSRTGFDVAAIAEKWPGGGGHAQAAAFSTDILPWSVVATAPVRCDVCSRRMGSEYLHPPGHCAPYAPTNTVGVK